MVFMSFFWDRVITYPPSSTPRVHLKKLHKKRTAIHKKTLVTFKQTKKLAVGKSKNKERKRILSGIRNFFIMFQNQNKILKCFKVAVIGT